ncbi:MAG: BlaI/MecI/CopY family transcriptional regulator [Sphingomonas bacterium]|uniref:BlaI/MecI/CopY family transcriptional regulator n=1 Tax=Sphingomonas bacterium TaxID=1895847 RepID=UPI00260D9708|nr:BlaI/MecI/CopY family transcriptional regulator [Sphingomonas bacterium]MDB5703320.1 BlaI/MecI/CopY family transcriptional regulator [Sphingomonas bacterium]
MAINSTPNPTPNPTQVELAILRVLWSRKEPMTVREVHEALSRSKDTAYTTVLKMLTIMADKGLARRDESERSHSYRAVHAEPVVQASLLKDLVRRAFSGSTLTLVQRALDDETASADDLEAMSSLIAQAKAKRKKG